MILEEIINKLAFIKLKTSASAKDNVKGMREWAKPKRKYLQKDTSGKGLLFKIDK